MLILFFLAFNIVTHASQDTSIDAKTIGDKGIAAIERGNLIEAMKLLTESAEIGYAPAQTTLAYLLDKSDYDKDAADLYQKAADQNNADGQYGLSTMYAKGEGVKKDLEKATHWLKKAAEQQHVIAMREYAMSYENAELGLDIDFNQAIHWYKKAANKSDLMSLKRLKNAHLNGELGLPKNKVEADSWNERYLTAQKDLAAQIKAKKGQPKSDEKYETK